MDLVPDTVHRALAYIALMNGQGIEPSTSHVNLYVTEPAPRQAQYESPLAAITQSALYRGIKVKDAEPVVAYLIRMGWVQPPSGIHDGLALTKYGLALLAGLEGRSDSGTARDSAEIDTDRVLDPKDPDVYLRVTRWVAEARSGMLVDPYFKADMLGWLLDATSISRVLTSNAGAQEKQVAAISIGMNERPGADRLEVRATNSKELHDRCIVTEDGRVHLIGISLTGLGKQLSSIVRLDLAASQLYRRRLERVWESAERVDPRPLRAVNEGLQHE